MVEMIPILIQIVAEGHVHETINTSALRRSLVQEYTVEVYTVQRSLTCSTTSKLQSTRHFSHHGLLHIHENNTLKGGQYLSYTVLKKSYKSKGLEKAINHSPL